MGRMSKSYLVTLVTLLLVTSSLAAGPGYHVVKKYTLGGEGGWDYLTGSGLAPSISLTRQPRGCNRCRFR